MKKLLILAYDFPPYVSVGGLRPYNWFKNLKKNGIEPIVVTRQWVNQHGTSLDYISPSITKEVIVDFNENGTIIRAPFFPSLSNRLLLKYGEKRLKFLRKGLTGMIEVMQFFLPVGSKLTLYKAANEYLKQNKVDAIIATGEPFVLFHYAKKLSDKHEVPWIADYRDPWTKRSKTTKDKFLNFFKSKIESNIVKKATYISTVSEFVQSDIHRNVGKKPVLISPNGYDSDIIKSIEGINQKRDLFSIAFAGSIYPWNPIFHFLDGMNTWVEKNPDFELEIKFIGINLRLELENYIAHKTPLLKNICSFQNRKQNEELLKELKESHVMLLFNYYAYMGTKIFDYLGIERQILLCYTEDKVALDLKKKFYPVKEDENYSWALQAQLIEDTNSGICVKDQNHLLQSLNELAAEFRETKKIRCKSKRIEEYSRQIQVEKLAEVLKSKILQDF